ncbi:Ger(x)C family spore germination protein [Oscillospiraceae bacterium MB08-C2-2]|nr:Ger(x)C family spore germination protein [Oscillospiraceae bacterium MB08-C2-2]
MMKQIVQAAEKTFGQLAASLIRPCAKKARRVAVLLLCVSLILLLCSCWSQRELNSLAIVTGVALDVGDEPDSLKLTAQVVKPGELGAGSSAQGHSGEKAFVNISYTDKSILSAARGITHMQNRRLYFAHNDVLIFSQDLAKQNIGEGLDSFTRDYEGRMNVNMLIARDTASEILNEDVELEKVPAIHISGMMENQKSNSETVIMTLRDFAIATLSESTAPVVSMVELYESEGKKYARMQGTAVFKQGKMIGELNTAETRGLLRITDKAVAGAVTVETEWGQVVLEIQYSKSRLKPVKAADGSIHMELVVDVDGVLQSNETYQDMSTPENVEMLKGKMKEFILSDIDSALAKARELSADVFSFGDAIHREYPKEWKQIKDSWEEEFPKIQLNTQIKVELRSTSGLIKPIVPGGAK